jgi:hypothetical protein
MFLQPHFEAHTAVTIWHAGAFPVTLHTLVIGDWLMLNRP